MPAPRFREEKTRQAAAVLRGCAAGTLGAPELAQLLYLADCAALNRRGRPITFAPMVSGPVGPELRDVAALVASVHDAHGPELGAELSDTEAALLVEVFETYGRLDAAQRAEALRRTVPAWTPADAGRPIPYRAVLRAGGRTVDEIAEIEQEIEAVGMLDAACPGRA